MVDLITPLGYPLYFLYIIGIWKILGVIAILVPRFKLVKEWAYAGFFFLMTGALVSHLASGDHGTQAQAGRLLADALRAQRRNQEAIEIECQPFMR